MLASAAVAQLVAERCGHLPIVVDPVLRSTTGTDLAGSQVITAYRDHLIPAAAVVTPNHHEAEVLGSFTTPAVITGSETGEDHLVIADHLVATFAHDRVETGNDHGTGCTFSAALAAYLALGVDLQGSVRLAGTFTASHLRASQTWDLGRGRGPIAHTILRPRISATPATPTGGNR
jgi:hydroxymethylpyrimidine/phosphomethylpyrimidine kinase